MQPLNHFQYTAPARPCQSILDIKGLKCTAGLASLDPNLHGPRQDTGERLRVVSEPLPGVRPRAMRVDSPLRQG